MNIFLLDEDVQQAARYHNDKHVVKMILETAQLLSTAHHVYESPLAESLYRKTHVNHPSAVWVRESASNYVWAYYLFEELCNEYTFRYGKVHKTWVEKSDALMYLPENMPDRGLTEFPQCMPDECKVEGNPVQAYRNYYKMHKNHIAKWTNREVPYWWN
jgi:hypothetical protein